MRWDNVKNPVAILAATLVDSCDVHYCANLIAMVDKYKDLRVGKAAFMCAEALISANVGYFKGNYYWYYDGIYRELTEVNLELAIVEAMRALGFQEDDLTKRRATLLKTPKEEIKKNPISPKREMIAFDNGVLNFLTREWYSFSPSIHVVACLPYSYDTNAKCPKWDKFLGEVLPDVSRQKLLGEYLGLIFMDRTKIKLEKVAVLLGSGANGKSVVHDVVEGLLGNWNITKFELGQLMGDEERAMHKLATMDGKLLNYCSELDKKELHGSGFKKIVSGEPVMARYLFKESYRAENIPLMMANANEMPISSDKSDGFYRRWLIIRFDVKISTEQQNLNLSSELQDELAGIFNWVMAGKDRFLENKKRFTHCEDAETAAYEFKSQGSSELIFLSFKGYLARPCHSKHKRERMGKVELYKAYKGFCEDGNYRAMSDINFAKGLADRGFELKRDSVGWFYKVFQAPLAEDWDRITAMGWTDTTREEWLRVINGQFVGSGLVDEDWDEETAKKAAPVQTKLYDTPYEEEEEFDPSNPYGMPADPED